MRPIKNLMMMLIMLIPSLSFAILKPFTKADCDALAMPKTVLLVHASWCPHCRNFLPVYERVSNLEKYKDWVFYQMVNDRFSSICGKSISGVPVTFKDNMNKKLSGNKSQTILEDFLDSAY